MAGYCDQLEETEAQLHRYRLLELPAQLITPLSLCRYTSARLVVLPFFSTAWVLPGLRASWLCYQADITANCALHAVFARAILLRMHPHAHTQTRPCAHGVCLFDCILLTKA